MVAYEDGTVLLEMSTAGPRQHREARFVDFGEASVALALPVKLAAGEVRLRAEQETCCPNYQVFRFETSMDPMGGRATQTGNSSPSSGATVTWVRYGFGSDHPSFSASEFRAFRKRVAAYKCWLVRNTKSLAARLGLNDEVLQYATRVEGLSSLEERLQWLGLAEQFADVDDEEWPAEVCKVTEEIRAMLMGGRPLLAALRDVLCRHPAGGPLPEDAVDFTGWEAVMGPASASVDVDFERLRQWLACKNPDCGTVSL